MTNVCADVEPFGRDPLAFLVERGESATEPLMPLHLGPDPVYLLTDPNYIKPLLNISEELVDKGPMVKHIRAATGYNTVTLSGPIQRPRRAAMHSVVGATAVAPLTPLLAAEVRDALAELVKKQKFDARVFGGSMAIRLLCVVAFGANAVTSEEHELLTDCLDVVLGDLLNRVFGGEKNSTEQAESDRRLESAKQSMHQLVKRVRDRTPDSDAARAFSALELSETDMANENLLFLIAGHDTTGSAAAWLCHILATVPGLSDLIAAEAAAVRDENGEIEFAKLGTAKTTIATVQELLRLYPSVYWQPRGTREEIEFAGRKLEKDTSIVISQWLFHRCARFWDAPNEFRLDRNNLKSKAYIPFGAGPRVCVGGSFALLELQILALEIASNLELTPTGLVGAPRPLVHLWPPSIPMEAKPRATAPLYMLPSMETSHISRPTGPLTGCPIHAHLEVG